jgi:hypothetical protein
MEHPQRLVKMEPLIRVAVLAVVDGLMTGLQPHQVALGL